MCRQLVSAALVSRPLQLFFASFGVLQIALIAVLRLSLSTYGILPTERLPLMDYKLCNASDGLYLYLRSSMVQDTWLRRSVRYFRKYKNNTTVEHATFIALIRSLHRYFVRLTWKTVASTDIRFWVNAGCTSKTIVYWASRCGTGLRILLWYFIDAVSRPIYGNFDRKLINSIILNSFGPAKSKSHAVISASNHSLIYMFRLYPRI